MTVSDEPTETTTIVPFSTNFKRILTNDGDDDVSSVIAQAQREHTTSGFSSIIILGVPSDADRKPFVSVGGVVDTILTLGLLSFVQQLLFTGIIFDDSE